MTHGKDNWREKGGRQKDKLNPTRCYTCGHLVTFKPCLKCAMDNKSLLEFRERENNGNEVST